MTVALASPGGTGLATALAGELRYSTVWEDHLLLEQALRIESGDELLVIAGAGCNVLNLLLRAPRHIVAIDFNPAQAALVELKLAALRLLEHDELLALLGIDPHDDVLALYERVRPLLGTAARRWWDVNVHLLSQGIEQAGRLERYIAGFREQHLLRIHTRDRVERIFTIASPAERRRYVIEEIFTPALVDAFRGYFTAESLASRGRSAEQSRYVNGVDVPGWFLRRLRWACAVLPTRGNFYLQRFLLGTVAVDEVGPPYLRRATYERLRALAPRVEVVCAPLEEYLVARRDRLISKAALSDAFEYLSEDESNALFACLAERMAPRARLAYWNLFVRRQSPESLRHRVRPLERLSHALWRRDRAWFYSAFHVEELCVA